MPRLLQHRLDPASRLARLMFAEYGVAIDLEEIKPWTRDPALLEINPAATVPILVDDGTPPVVGTLAVLHAIEDRYVPTAVAGLFPSQAVLRNEMWRLLVPNGELTVVSYYGAGSRYAADPAACNVLNEQTWAYFDPAHKAGLWQVYQPQPWQIRALTWAVDGNIEVTLGKR